LVLSSFFLSKYPGILIENFIQMSVLFMFSSLELEIWKIESEMKEMENGK
jgi:hypothetical protein